MLKKMHGKAVSHQPLSFTCELYPSIVYLHHANDWSRRLYIVHVDFSYTTILFFFFVFTEQKKQNITLLNLAVSNMC